jgi:hypothetical protein
LALVLAGPCWAAVTPNGLIVLLTDYGADSVYVGILKGAIYAKFPQAHIDTLTNSVPAFDVMAGAYLLADSCDEFPRGTTFCCVVDPGVGAARKRIVLETKTGRLFVGPDNGLLSLAARRFGIADLREATKAVLWREGEVSQTFQGRDIFGPVAAALARGVPLAEVGPELKNLVKIEIGESRVEGEVARGQVIRADPYGNLITNITAEDLARISLKKGDSVAVTIGKAHYTAPLKSTYADVPEGKEVILVQSMGYIECAVNRQSLAERIGEGLRAPVLLKKVR